MILVVAALFLLAGTGRAELQRVEAVGIYGIRDGMRSKVIPRDEAIARARWEGVSRVALELVGESAPSEAGAGQGDPQPAEDPGEAVLPPIDSLPGGEDAPRAASPTDTEPGDRMAALEAALGKDVLPYMRSYRILEDRGEVPVLFKDAPDVSVEYVVVVEVIVDVDRVTRALEDAGLITSAGSQDAGESVIVELIGLSRFEPFQRVVDALREELRATKVRTLEFARGRQVLSVEGPFGPEALSARLARLTSPGLDLEPVGIDSEGRRILLVGRWAPESEGSADANPAGSERSGAPRS